MYNNLTKSGILALLIILTIIQTSKLWLGSASSLNFFQQNTAVSQKPIMPSNIWVHKGVGYKVNSDQGGYERIALELSSLIASSLDSEKVKEKDNFSWESILAKQGIFLDYSLSLDVQDIVGEVRNKQKPIRIDKVFLDMTSLVGEKLDICLIDTQSQKAYILSSKGDITGIKKVYDTLNAEDMTFGLMKYQSSFKTLNKFIRGNIFLPLSNQENPLNYEVLTAELVIDNDKEDYVDQLSKYMNNLFVNPLVKNEEILGDGTVVFTENMKNIVSYTPLGVTEYINLKVSEDKGSMTMLEGYNKALNFIAESQAFSYTIKDAIYLNDIQKEGNEYTYVFDLMHNGYRVNLSDVLKQSLDIEGLISLTVRNKEIVSGKWWFVDILEKKEDGHKIIGSMPIEYMEPINQIFTQLVAVGETDILLDDVRCIYLLEAPAQEMHIRWGVLLDGKWYYP